MSESLRRRFAEFKSHLDLLPEAEEPPPTMLHVLGRSQQEQDWQRLLFHYLTPEEAHGLDHALLEHFLSALSGRGDLEYTFSRFDLDDVRVETEVITSNERRPDAVVWSPEDWFICWELKVEASEGEDQTCDYVKADSFRSIGLDKYDVPSDGHHYVYLAPHVAAPPEADEFVPISWEWVASHLQSFIADSHGQYPARTTAQLGDFIGTIRSELTMTEYQENQQEKRELFLDYYDEISKVQAAFMDEWERFTENWGTRLAWTLDAAGSIEDSNAPDEYEIVELETNIGDQRRWTFRQSHSDWSWMFPREWWTKLDESRQIYDTHKPNARVGFVHRLGKGHQSVAVGDRELKFYLRNAYAGHDDFYENFAKRFNTDDEIPEMLPPQTSKTGNDSDVLESTYDIDLESHDDFFEAYIAGLSRAITDHVVSNPALVKKIDSLYHDTIAQDTPFGVPDSLSRVVNAN